MANNQNKRVKSIIFHLLLLFAGSQMNCFAQNSTDTINLPKITIESLNGYGPYTMGSQRTNYFMAYDLPENTSKITFRMIDSEGIQINQSFIEEGVNLQSAYWEFESDTMNFPLSPRLNVEVHYQGDSIANYYIPYLIYADTVWFSASDGWGPFVTNNYQRNDIYWSDVPEKLNTFKATNFPPRCDTVMFKIFSADSTVIDSLVIIAENEEYLDSASFENVRMDLLPLTTRYIEVVMFCEGGPQNGVVRSKELTIIPQSPKLFTHTDIGITEDSVPGFVQNQTAGQALMIGINKYAEVQNGPGLHWQPYEEVRYRGPHSHDIIEGEFTIEAWLQFDWNEIYNSSGEMDILNVGDLWTIKVTANQGDPKLQFTTNVIPSNEPALVEVNIPTDTAQEWHYIAYSYYYDETDQSYNADVYWDGNQLDDWHVLVNDFWFEGIATGYPYKNYMKTDPLIIGSNNSSNDLAAVKAIDELRIWNAHRSLEEIKSNFKKSILQSPELIGYYNFDDRRNRLKTVSDISYYNNIGKIRNSAYFISQNTEIEHLSDTLVVTSSNAQTDSIVFAFINDQNDTLYSQSVSSNSNSLYFDISTLPYETRLLQISEYYPGCPDTGFISNYNVNIVPPTPIATPKYNWSTFYESDGLYDELINTLLVSGLPENTTKVELGLEKDGEEFDVNTYTQNSIPYRGYITLNGTDNYIETSNKISAPTTAAVTFWFKTSTAKGGRLLCFGTTQNGVNSTRNERELIMMEDGSLRFIVDNEATLYGEHAYNDGEWHYVELFFGILTTEMHLDGAKVDSKSIGYLESYNGYWVIGRNHANKNKEYKSLAEYFNGTIAHLELGANNYDNNAIYIFNEGTGTAIEDSNGNNDGLFKGSSQRWAKFDTKTAFISWEGNMINKDPGVYTFYAKLFYDGGSEGGTQ